MALASYHAEWPAEAMQIMHQSASRSCSTRPIAKRTARRPACRKVGCGTPDRLHERRHEHQTSFRDRCKRLSDHLLHTRRVRSATRQTPPRCSIPFPRHNGQPPTEAMTPTGSATPCKYKGITTCIPGRKIRSKVVKYDKRRCKIGNRI